MLAPSTRAKPPHAPASYLLSVCLLSYGTIEVMTEKSHDLTLTIGHDELTIRDRYETLSILNDILIGVIFLVGSILFFSESTTYEGTWLFVIGSVLMLIRPCIRITRRFHLQKVRAQHPSVRAPHESSFDY